ncbi:TPA: hypothetical protein ACF367_002953 [Vibrio parahaemolyticus]|uniref:hypothetical protein n=1 Tax=Vibrio parahaemolyticus TaxID=670 RepID=UPI001121A9A2|nr:hypothetical protein [Vibrio parahaemolyticus]EGQ7674498.1 hypothetical protein [Vibrio parahaemolyticus]EGQ9217359.1 hypothetical protein [Vibrio parahaemolyticus]TOM95613.1 hypothetical protein CGH65_23110 [Vibrio parahaemolyticus]HBC3911897.1 hypothetical protein [Vibrio parahaemolyticus]
MTDILINRTIYVFVFIIISTGCTAHTTVDERGRVVIHNFGYVKIIKSPVISVNKEINVTGYKLFGFSVGEGLTLGYKSNEYMSIPMDCRLLIIVQNQNQMEQLLDELDFIEDSEICATVSLE